MINTYANYMRLAEELEQEQTSHTKTRKLLLEACKERDDAEQALSHAYYLITGKSPEWSNLFGHAEALEEIDTAQYLLRTEIASFKRLEREQETKPMPHADSELAQADIKSLNQKSDICEHFATRDLISSVLRRAGVPGSDNLGKIVASALSNEDIPCITHFVQGVDCSLCEESAPHTHRPLDAEHYTGNRIRTSFVNPPIPIRHFDWVAWIDGDEETGLAGNGKTEQEAINELIALQMVYDESNVNTEAAL